MRSSFPYIFSQKFCKHPMFLRFLAKNSFLLIFTYITNASKFPRARWLYDVTVTSLTQWRHMKFNAWYSFWYQWIEEVHYTLVANIGVSGVPYRCNTPFLRWMCYKRYLRRTRVKGPGPYLQLKKKERKKERKEKERKKKHVVFVLIQGGRKRFV